MKKNITPQVEIVEAPNSQRLGVVDNHKFVAVLKTLLAKEQSSLLDGYYIEYSSIILYKLELFLKLWLAKKVSTRNFQKEEYLTFGSLISEVENVKNDGFDSELIKRMRTFNKEARIEAIHKLLYSEIKYEDLKDIVTADPNLFKDVMDFVKSSIKN